MGKITIPYKPRALQQAIHDSLKRFNVFVCHRRFGKSVLSINQLLKDAVTLDKHNPRFAYLAPQRNQAKQVIWDYLKHYSGVIPGVKYNEAELRADFPNGGRVTLYGTDNPDALRGIFLDGCVLDEFAQMPPRVWGEILIPVLTDRNGYAIFIGTPMGRNHFHDIWEDALEDPDWFSQMYKASQTGILSPEQLAQARKQMSEEQYNQEFECSFEAAIRGAYYGRLMEAADRDGRITTVPYDPALPVDTAWDLGMGDMTAIWMMQSTRSGEVRAIDYYENSGEGLAHYVKVLREKPYIYGTHFAPHDIKVRELGTGKSRIEVAKSLGIDFRALPIQPLEDGIEAVRLTLPKVWFDKEKTKNGMEALRQYRAEYDDKKKALATRPVHDWTEHGASAFRYYCMGKKEELTNTRKREPRRLGRDSSVSWMGA